ncbi:Trihelix transcription factor PTL [Striga hermonthica]|uniref:Trihelix transcription factor PTL n=1 Tax=Striga hermonthica TaxID=68872 RepID=A0A9N7NI92_STRHE|nr:Trihelix transcription factor PTL [Striga hermonthica]
MEDQYGLPDLRRYVAAGTNFLPPAAADLLSVGRGLGQPHPYGVLAAGTGGASGAVGGGCYGGFEGGDGGAGRWPRQETLTLLEVRSRLDGKFKEANQKGPLWDEVSRIMSEEHGYQRSGKKCREKFENLYKYYKKTKDGKAGRQDGKHYRFFRQLEALYGENNNNNSSASVSEAHHHNHHQQPHSMPTSFHYNYPKFSDNTSLSLSNYSEPDTTSTDYTDENGPKNPKRAGKTGWKAKIKDFIDLQMKSLMEKQEAWMEQMMTTIERKEQERVLREEEWRKQDAARVEREHQFWAGERAWIEARDAALMEALHKLTGKEFMAAADLRGENVGLAVRGEMWPENGFWEEMGGNNSCVVVKSGKRKKEESKSCDFYGGGDGVYSENAGVEPVMRLNNDQSNSSPSNNNNNAMNESCFRRGTEPFVSEVRLASEASRREAFVSEVRRDGVGVPKPCRRNLCVQGQSRVEVNLRSEKKGGVERL